MRDSASSGIVYVCEAFPALSQTFVQNELRELHRLGIRPRVFALYPPKVLDPTAGDLAFVRLPSASLFSRVYAGAVMRVGLRHPLGLAHAVALAVARPSRFQFHALGKAVLLLDALGPDRPDRLHAHFARASASTAMLAAAALRTRFSFTAHANDVFANAFDTDRKLRRADVTVTVCEFKRRALETRWPGLGKIVVVPCGVQVDKFVRAQPYRRDPFTIVAVGRLVEKKGFDDLVRACALLRDQGIDFSCRIIGEGPERGCLEVLVAELGLADRVALEGSATPIQVREALERASVFCLPCVIASSGDLDSQPVVVKEAMAMELPVVGTDEVGMSEMVDDRNGRLVPPRDPRSLAAALGALASTDEQDLLAMGRAGRQRAEDEFPLAQLAAKLAASWQGLG